MKKNVMGGLLFTLFLGLFTFLPQPAQAGLVVNETNVDVCFEYFWTCWFKIPRNGRACIRGFADFPVFTTSEGLYCLIPFFTSGTTVRVFYIDGKPTCCRDCISNKPCDSDQVVFAPSGDTLDLNGDGTITQAEFVGLIGNLFNRADQDGNQVLSREELNLGKDGSLPMDGDRNGTVTLDESVGGLLKIFTELDTDRNGLLQGREYQALATYRPE